MLKLAIWTAVKDFHEVYIEDRQVGLQSAACNASLVESLRPTPVVKRSDDAAATTHALLARWTVENADDGQRRHYHTRHIPHGISQSYEN